MLRPEMPEIQRLSFEERLWLLVDRERTLQENRRLARPLAMARLQLSATLEDLDYRHPRGLDKGVIASLTTGQWIRSHDNVLIVGPTGACKTYLTCALAGFSGICNSNAVSIGYASSPAKFDHNDAALEGPTPT